MIARNMIFTAKFRDITLEILVGADTTGGIYYLPDDMFVEDLIIEGGFKDELPIGMPIASSMKLKINTSSFTSEMSPLGRWIRDNDNGLGIPNIWIVRRAGNVEFIGVQTPANVEKHKPKENLYELTAVSIFKFAMEKIYLEPDTASLDGTTLDRQILDYVKIDGSNPLQLSVTNIYGNGYTKTELMNEFLANLFKRFLDTYYILMRIEFTGGFVFQQLIPTLFKQNRVKNSNTTPSEILNNAYLITEIWHSENGTADLTDLKGGYRKYIADRYKNYWNFMNALTLGLAQRFVLNITNSDLSLSIKTNYIHLPLNERIVIENEDLLGNANEITDSYNDYRVSNNRHNSVYGTDIAMASINVSGGSTAKATFETSCLLNTIGNTVATHEHNVTFNLQGAGGVGCEYLALNDQSIKDNEPIQATQLYYWDLVGGVNQLHKVADYCEIGDIHSSATDGNVFANTNLTDFNKAINSMQSGGLNEICNRINANVLCERELWLKCVLPLDKANNSLLGYDYQLNLTQVFKPNYFYEDIEFGTHGVLVKVKENLTKNECECTFFIRSDEWQAE